MSARERPDPRRWWAADGRWWLAAALVALAGLAVAMVWVPMRTLRPFAPQSSAGLARAYAIERAAPLVGLAALLVGGWIAWRLWRSTRWLGRVAAVAALLVIGGAGWLARQDLFESMFRPLPRPGYVMAGAADFVEPADMVLAVEVRGEAVAYPVRQVAYHHIVQDVVGGTPVAVTY